MRRVSGLVTIAAACAAFAIAAPASAAVIPCTSGPGIDLTVNQCVWSPGPPGNDFRSDVEAAIWEATGANVSLTLFGKSGNPGLFSFSPNADPKGLMSTDWTVLDGTLIKYVTIKAANEFKVYELAGLGASSGVGFSTEGLTNPGGKRPGISHLSFWTVPSGAVPEPATWALMLLGFGALGWAMRRRSPEDSQPRIRVSYN